MKGEWQAPPPDKRLEWIDTADDRKRFKVVERWHKTAAKLGTEHRRRGLELIESEVTAHAALGKGHLEQAIVYDPFDREAHEALGHEERGGYFGTAEQLDFVDSLKEVESTALKLARTSYEVEPVDEIPDELERMDLEFSGARSKHFTIFTRGSQENANDIAQWGERALDFFEFCAGRKYGRRARRVMKGYSWIGYVWTVEEFNTFKELNPKLVTKNSRLFANLTWPTKKGPVELTRKLTPAGIQDHLIAHVVKRTLQDKNDGLVEGLVHASTWFLKSTCMTRYGAVPQGTMGAAEVRLPDGANWWQRKIRDQAISGTDFPANGVAREPLYKFRNDARLKAWSFMTWLVAARRSDWIDFVLAVPSEKIPFPAEVDKAWEKCYGTSLAEAELRWREWASGRGVTAAATGYGPPLLPEKPNKDEVEGLARLNTIRAMAGLPACELDAEASLACAEHAEYLALHPEHHKWPDAHEQDPAKEGFTPRGMRAGLRSVIVINADDPEESLDQWIGTVYHRFPLLEYSIRRIGFALREDMCVLDMGSLEEPKTAEMNETYGYVKWPPNGMDRVPTVFAFVEHPNPLEDVGLDFEDQKHTGYPVSLQLADYLANDLVDGKLELFVRKTKKGKTGGGRRVAVECWAHTPKEPLLKRMADKNVLFLIPKEHLESDASYFVVATLTYPSGTVEEKWRFKTGRQGHGLGKREPPR